MGPSTSASTKIDFVTPLHLLTGYKYYIIKKNLTESAECQTRKFNPDVDLTLHTVPTQFTTAAKLQFHLLLLILIYSKGEVNPNSMRKSLEYFIIKIIYYARTLCNVNILL